VITAPDVVLAEETDFDPDEVYLLYDSVGWYGYTRDLYVLCRSLEGSHLVVTARDPDGLLLGLARTISDGSTICYVQDLLVHPEHQRQGIGRALTQHLIGRYSHCRSFLLSTDDESTPDGAASHAFYRSMGLVPHHEQGLAALGLPVRRD